MSDVSQSLSKVEQPLGPRLRVARENAGLSQQELALRLGVETDSLVAWENDLKHPRANRLLMLCGILDVSIKWLFEGAEGAYMARGDDPVPSICADLERLRSTLAEAERLATSLSARVEVLRARRKTE